MYSKLNSMNILYTKYIIKIRLNRDIKIFAKYTITIFYYSYYI